MKTFFGPMWSPNLLMPLFGVILCISALRVCGEEAAIKEKIAELRKAAQAGDTEAQYMMGLAYFMGKGLDKDEVKAAECFRIAATGGRAEAQFLLGNCYEYGWGVGKNQAEAAKWHDKAAKQGYVEPAYYITADDIKKEWLGSQPTARTMDRDYNKIVARNAAFILEVREGKHDQRAAMEAAVRNESEAVRTKDKEKVGYYANQVKALNQTYSAVSSKTKLSREEQSRVAEACNNAQTKRLMSVASKQPDGWTNPVSAMVSFLTSDEVDNKSLPSEFAGCAIIVGVHDEIVVIKMKGLSVSSQLDYLVAFVPSGSVEGAEISGEQRDWRITAPWPASKEMAGSLQVGELAALRKDDRIGAAEIKMMLGDKEGCLRHMRILKRDYLRMNDRLSATKVDVLLLYQQ